MLSLFVLSQSGSATGRFVHSHMWCCCKFLLLPVGTGDMWNLSQILLIDSTGSLWHKLPMVFAAQKDGSAEEQNALDDARAQEVVTAFKTLLSGLSPEIQERVRNSLFQSFPVQTPRPREYIATILKLVPRGLEVTVDDVKKTVEAEGIHATAKGIADALGYLTRTQRITRLGHGRYMIEGAGELTTLEELEGAGPPTRDMIDDY